METKGEETGTSQGTGILNSSMPGPTNEDDRIGLVLSCIRRGGHGLLRKM